MVMKQCSKCRCEKEDTAFYKCSFVKSGLSSWCKSCDAEKRVKYQSENKQKTSEYQKDYYKLHKDRISIRNKKVYDRDPKKHLIKWSKRRAYKLQATPTWANHNYIELFYRMANEESLRTGQFVEVDHIIPLKHSLVCGLHCEHNLQLLFKSDNRSKGNSYAI
jgi:hypothetical protein